MSRMHLLMLLLLLCTSSAPRCAAAEPVTPLRDGDRILLVGGTLIEREQRYGYWETGLVSAYPNCNITIRNLGWSGDTVFGDARAGFDTAKEGYRRLVDHIVALKPTVVLIAYGGNEAFDGDHSLPRFRDGLRRLLADVAKTQARIGLIAPLPHAVKNGRIPNPAEYNRTLLKFRNLMYVISRLYGYGWFQLMNIAPTDASNNLGNERIWAHNGMHLTPFGYRETALKLEKALDIEPRNWNVSIDAQKGLVSAKGAIVAGFHSAPLTFQVTDRCLPLSDGPVSQFELGAMMPRVLRVVGLSSGLYALRIDKKTVATGTAELWSKGVEVVKGPQFEQLDQLRSAIIEKNQLYFYRWRPQNETYLFGFRKHEQGQNAKEVVMFDPLIDRREKEIARLRKPVPHQYEITPVSEEQK